ncbi:MAG: hypothetical protein JW739_01360 [Opitutales bacterium]|nr:hypothetical protein [Opitutales bacterium]
MTLHKSIILPLTALLAVFSGCGKKEAEPQEAARDNTAEIQAYYETKLSIPPDVLEAYEAGKISEEELDKMKAEGKFDHYFSFKTIDELPQGLNWEDGMDLPELGDDNAKKGGTWYYYLQDFPRTLRTVGPDANGGFRPFINEDVDMWLAYPYPESREVTQNGFRYYPGLADRWAVDKANKTVYIHLNPDARWSDGEEVTTEDVAFTLFFMQSKYIQAPWYNNAYQRYIIGLTVYDDYTFSFKLPEDKPDILARALEHTLYPRHFYKELGEDYVERYQWKFKPTTGAYVVLDKDVKKGSVISLTRNKDWWAKDQKFFKNRFNFDKVRFTVVRDPSKAFEMFKKGELDDYLMNTPEYNYDKFPDDNELIQKGYVHKATFYNDRPRPTYGMNINTVQPLLDNADIRRGIAYASNWDLVIEKFFRNDAVRMRTSADGFGEFTHPTLQPYPFDVEKALECFAKAGFTQRGPDGILVNAKGQRLSFTLTTGYATLKSIMEILQQEAIKAGLDLRVEVLDQTAAWKKFQEKKHDIAFFALNVGVEVYPRYWEMWHTVNAYNNDGSIKTQTNNTCSYSNPEMDKLIEQYRASSNAEEMKQLAFRMEEILHEDSPFIPGFVLPFIRQASWRWIRYPEHGVGMTAGTYDEFWMRWVDEDIKKETKEAMQSGETLPPESFIWDQYNAYK